MNTAVKVVLLIFTGAVLIAATVVITYFATKESLKTEDGGAKHFNRRVLFHHAPGPCKQLAADGGSEDLTILPDGLAIITAGLHKDVAGKMLLVNMSSPRQEVEELSIEGNFDIAGFSPHGLAVWQQPSSGKTIVKVVNHPDGGDRIEVFEFDGRRRKLKYIKSITNPKFGNMNDLVLLDEDKFYITQMSSRNDVDYWEKEINTKDWSGFLMYHDGTDGHIISTGLQFANGINASPDRRFIYMNEYAAGKIHVYKRNPMNNQKLEHIQTVETDTYLDNIEVERGTGDLLIGAHPNHEQMFAYLRSRGKSPGPSQVLRLKVNNDGLITDVIEMYLNNGTEIGAASIAGTYNGRMLIGSVYSQMIICDINCSGS